MYFNLPGDSQRGYLKFIILMIAVPLILLVFFKPKFSNLKPENSVCLIPPSDQFVLENFSIQEQVNRFEGTDKMDTRVAFRVRRNESPYNKISGKYKKLFSQSLPVPEAVFRWHFGRVGEVEVPYEVDESGQKVKRTAYIALTWCDGNSGGDPTEGGNKSDFSYDGKCTPDQRNVRASVNFFVKDKILQPNGEDNRVFNLLMLDVTPENNPQPEIRKFEYFIKEEPIHNQIDDPDKYPDGSIPYFIQEYCEKIGQNELLVMEGDSSAVPKQIDVSNNSRDKFQLFSPWTKWVKKLKTNVSPGDQERLIREGKCKILPAEPTQLECEENLEQTLEDPANIYKLVGFAPVDSPLAITSFFKYLTPNMVTPEQFRQKVSGESDLMSVRGFYEEGGKTYYYAAVSAAGFKVLLDQSNPSIAYYYAKARSPNGAQPSVSPSPSPEYNLQLDWIKPIKLPPMGWLTPECKPAIYLYPNDSVQVNVKVEPKGYLTFTDPVYPTGGWDVLAQPSGQLFSANKFYDYLYYESKIRDSAFNKPEKGFVVEYSQLPSLFSDVLPKLGLNSKETAQFKEYWEKALPEAKYYFVGVLDERTVDQIEPLTITPKPDTNIRVRLYFEALDAYREVEAPAISTPKRMGFVMSEWGGMVKVDQDHPFTCSQ